MLGKLKQSVRRMPLVGPWMRRLYRRAWLGEGAVVRIESGHLRGLRYYATIARTVEYYLEGCEQELQDLIAARLEPGQTFFDVGANAGFFSLLAGSRVGPRGRVVAFEPHPETVHYVRQLLKLNKFDHAQVIQAAVSDRVGVAEFADDRDPLMCGLAAVRGEQPRTVVRVNTTTLDEAVKQFGVPDMLKIDIEGAEIMALRGGQRLLTEHAPILLVELHSESLCREYFQLMAEHGYRQYEIGGAPITDGSHHRFVVSRKD